MIRIIKYVIIVFAIIFLIAILMYWQGINSTVSESGADELFIVAEGQSVSQVSQNLYDAGLIKSKFYFTAYIWQNKQQSNLQAGEYILNPSLTIKKITEILITGESLSQEITIKIIEGWNINDINQYLVNNGIITDNKFAELVKDNIGYWARLPKTGTVGQVLNIDKPEFLNDAPDKADLEGYLFPDTYRIYRNATTEEIIKKMLDNFDIKLTEDMRSEIKRQGKTIYQIITIASLIEKEVRTAEDMQIVSGIFWDRIKYGQALESCATLAHILGVNKKQYTIEDTKIESSYNTYQNLGLPPGPICNPGINAINAAIYPKYTEYNYFLNRTDTGETIFSKTFEEHNRNKAMYLK